VESQSPGDLAADLQTGLDRVLSPEATAKLKQQFSGLRDKAQSVLKKTPQTQSATPTPPPYEPLQPEDFGNPPVTVEASATPPIAVPLPPDVPQPVPEPPTPPVSAPPVTQTAKPAEKPNVFATLADTAKSVIAGFNKPKKNTSTYVRKDFRDATPETEEDDAFDFEEGQPSADQAVSKQSIPVDENGVSDSLIDADEIIQEEVEFEAGRDFEPESEIPEPIPPHPPSPELVDAAIADAEAKHLPADPPEVADETAKLE
jgi:hypothetical protein